jgi:methyl-accepting chemotaxis protein
MIEGLTDCSLQIASASERVLSSSQSLAEGSSEQASSLEGTSISMEEMSAQTEALMDQIKTLALLVGGTGGGESRSGEKKSRRGVSSRCISRVKKVKPDGNGHSVKNVPHNAGLEAVIPMCKNRIVEHSEDMTDF